MHPLRSFLAIILTLVTMLCVSIAQAAGPSFPNDLVPVVNIPRMSKAPVCDGDIQPEEWRLSVILAGVAEISTTKYYDRPHTFYIGWDEEHLYIAGHAHILPGFELSRSKRYKYTSGVVFDDAFETHLGVSVASHYLGMLLHRMGIALHRPKHVLRGKRDEQAHAAAKAELEALKKNLPNEERVVISQYEAKVHLFPYLVAIWCMVGSPQPEVPTPGKYAKRVVYGGLNLKTGTRTSYWAATKRGALC